MEQIKSIVADVIKDILAKQEKGPGGDIAEIWSRGATKKVARHTKFSFFKNGILYINVENSAWLYEVKSKKTVILKKLKKFSNNKILEVKFKVGDINGD